MDCPKCKQVNPPESEYCWACHHDFIPNAPVKGQEPAVISVSPREQKLGEKASSKRTKSGLVVQGWGVTFLFLAIATLVTVAWAKSYKLYLSSSSWTPVPAVITKSFVETKLGSKRGSSHRAHIEYAYDYGRVKYVADRINFGDRSGSAEYAHMLVARYPVGKKVEVFVSGGNPHKVILERSIGNVASFVFLGIPLWFLGLWNLSVNLKKRTASGLTPNNQP